MPCKKTLLIAAAALATSSAHAAVLTDGLTENFEAAVGSNTNALWENQVGSRDLQSNTPITLASATSSRTNIDTAYQFNGTAGFNDTQANGGGRVFSSLDNSNSFEIWFRPDDLTGGVLYESGGGKGMQIIIDGSGNISGYFENGLIIYALTTANLGYNPTSDFTQLVFTADQSGGATGTKLYINGALVATGGAGDWNGTGDADGLGESGGAFGGDGNHSNPGAFDGDIAIFRIYDDILSTIEVEGNYNAIVPEPTSLALMGLGGLCMMKRRRRS